MKSLNYVFAENLDLEADTSADLQQGPQALALEILRDVMQFRRVVSSGASCASGLCQACVAPHFDKIVSAITARKPIAFVLPAFPGKSPNLAKVLGPLPDMAEKQALRFLDGLCERVRRLYEPGARILLCSDGRVFSDIIGMNEVDVSVYQRELNQIIEELALTNLSTLTLDDLCEGHDYTQLRETLMKKYGKPLESLKAKVRQRDEEAHRIYCGITRFLLEDSMHPGQTKSRTAIQKDCKIRAYEVIRRSNAWSELIADRFPDAVRLSIHPQTCGAQKLGIQLLGTESWMTPWHGVAVDTDQGFVLMKRWEAEKLNAQLVRDSGGRESHYEL